jgi:hypothetical protein
VPGDTFRLRSCNNCMMPSRIPGDEGSVNNTRFENLNRPLRFSKQGVKTGFLYVV